MRRVSLRSFALWSTLLFTSIWIYRKYDNSEDYTLPPVNSFENPATASFEQWEHSECPFSSSIYSDNDIYNDDHPVEYARAVIRPRFNYVNRPSLTHIEDRSFLPALSAIDPFEVRARNSTSCLNTPINILDVAPDRPPRSQLNHIIFGIATTTARLEASLSSLKSFISNSLNTSLVALVPPDASINRKTQETMLRDAGLNVTLQISPLNYTARYFSLVPALTSHLASNPHIFNPNTTFLCLLDDDTFLPALAHLKHRLSLLPSPATKPYYIGAPSEAAWQVRHFGYQAFGGAGIFLSPSLGDTISSQFRVCADEKLGPQSMPGDQRLAKCIKKLSPKVKFRHWPELRQWDMKGDPRGVFESGKMIWSFHHLTGREGWLSFDVRSMAALKEVAGEEAVLRRWVFDKSTHGNGEREMWVLTAGYSITKYIFEKGAKGIDLEQTEKSWIEGAEGYAKSLGPLRVANREVKGLKVERWRLSRAEMKDGNLHQVYWKELSKDEGSAIELVWLGEKERKENTVNSL
ncbi:MAG: hypothetical protein Q9227_008025 [Pyrenula ochraceoflavens]